MSNLSLNPIINILSNLTSIIPKYFEEKTKVKNHQTTEINNTKRFKIEADRENRKSEINSTNEIVTKTLDNSQNITQESLVIVGETISKTQNNSQELNLNSIKHLNDTSNKTIDLTERLSESHNNKIERLSENHNLALSKNNKEMKNYQQALTIISERMIELRIKEDINSKYMKGVHNYTVLVAKYAEDLSNIKYNIKVTNKQIEPIQHELQEIESNLKIETRMFDRFNFEFEKSFEELEKIKFDYKDSMTEEKYLEHFKRSKRELRKSLNEISYCECRLLNFEKERLNKVIEITPLIEQLGQLNIHLNLLENSKENFEKVSMIGILNTATNNKVSELTHQRHEEIIDVLAEPI